METLNAGLLERFLTEYKSSARFKVGCEAALEARNADGILEMTKIEVRWAWEIGMNEVDAACIRGV